MPLVSELKLPHLPLDHPDFDRDPLPFLKVARARHPWLATSDFGYFVHGYRAAKSICFMDDRLLPSFDAIIAFYDVDGTPWARFMREQLLGHSGAKHHRIRKSVGDAFMPRALLRQRDTIRTVVSDLLDLWAPLGAFDFTQFAAEFPITVLCRLLGTPPEDIPSVRDALETQVEMTSWNRDIRDELLASYDILWSFCDRAITARERDGASDGGLLDDLIRAKTSGQIDETELRFLLMILFPAGYDTSKNMLSMTMQVMLDHPDHWRRCAEDRAFCDRVVDEMFRYKGVACVFRTVAAEFSYEDVTFPAGTQLVLGNSLAARDPEAVADADRFDPDRPQAQRHIGYGRGNHVCLGQHLANLQIAEGLHLIAQRLRDPRPDGPVQWRPYLGVWGPRSLPIRFTAASGDAS